MLNRNRHHYFKQKVFHTYRYVHLCMRIPMVSMYLCIISIVAYICSFVLLELFSSSR